MEKDVWRKKSKAAKKNRLKKRGKSGKEGRPAFFLSLFFSPLEIEYYGASELEQLDMGHRVIWEIFLRGTGIPTKDGSWVHGTVRICLQDWSGQI